MIGDAYHYGALYGRLDAKEEHMTITIDSDAHVVEPVALWQEYADPADHELIAKDALGKVNPDQWPEQVFTDAGGRDWVQINTSNPKSIVGLCTPGGLTEAERARSLTWDDMRPASYDPHVRIKEMDAVGVDVTMLYPTLGLFFGSLSDPQLAAAACRGYNNWMADFCQPYPDRLYNVAPVPLQGVDEAVKEMRRVVTELGVKAVMIRPNPYKDRRLSDPAYGPFWAEAQELDCTVGLHSSVTGDMPTVGFERYPDFFRRMVIAHPFEQQMACMDLICGGVLEQYPRLRIAIVETGGGWLPYWLARLDDFHGILGRMLPPLSLKPSEYFQRQCFLACESDDVAFKMVEALGMEDVLMWASDYPHFDCEGPDSVKELRKSCEGLPESVQRKVFGENAARCYGLE